MSLVLKPSSRSNDIANSQSVDSHDTDISLLKLKSDSQDSKATTAWAVVDYGSQGTEITLLAIESESDARDSTSLSSYRKDTLDNYADSNNSIESIDTVIDNSEKQSILVDTV